MKKLILSLLAGTAAIAMVGAVQAADLIIDEPMMSPGVVNVGGNWEGVYVGGFVGGASGTFDAEADDTWFDFDDSIGVSGWLLGVNVGANFYLTEGIVAGVVGDIAWSDASGDVYDGFSSYEINWSGSLRGRLGYDGGAIMPYVTGGLAFANGTFSFGGVSSSDSQTHIGWTVGAGVEVAVTEDLSIDALYRYSDYGSQTYYSTAPDLSLTSHQVTLGLNWKF